MTISTSLSTLLQRLRFAASHSTELLAPRSSACAICGKSLNNAGSSASYNLTKLRNQLRQSVCGACLSAIPWLSRIRCLLCGRGIHCDDCHHRPHRSFVCNRSAVDYDATMREWLARYKYRGDERLAPLLADMLLPAFERMTADLITLHANHPALTFSQSKRRFRPKTANFYWDAITFVPVSAERAIERGFNQAEQLAYYFTSRYKLPLFNLLIRNRHTEKMSFKSRQERLRDAGSLFGVNNSEFQKLKQSSSYCQRVVPAANTWEKEALGAGEALRVLLIDDIYTTGSTADACANVLRRHADMPLEVYILTWARS